MLLISSFLFRALKKILYDERKVSNEIFFYLNKLNNGKNFFITTNIDISFQKYLGLGDENISINPNFSNPPKLINYLHGRIDREDSWIFTTAQYNRAYNSNENGCRSFLQYIFETYNVLFIGYGLREDDIKRIIYLTNELTNRRKTHFG